LEIILTNEKVRWQKSKPNISMQTTPSAKPSKLEHANLLSLTLENGLDLEYFRSYNLPTLMIF